MNNSRTKVNPKHGHGVGLWNNKRVVVGIRVDEGLYNAFKPIAKRVFGSVCNPIEAFMATIISCAENGVNFGSTVKVGHIVIERNIRSRRKLEIVEETEVTEKIVEVATCFVCNREAVGEAVHEGGKHVLVCEKHLEELRDHLKWRVLRVG